MEIVKINQILKRYRKQQLVYGELDCNLMFLEIYEPELFELLSDRYTTTMGGARVAKKETGYSSIKSFIENSDKYVQKSFNSIAAGDVLINGLHVAICLGNYTFGLVDNKFTLTKTETFNECLVFAKER